MTSELSEKRANERLTSMVIELLSNQFNFLSFSPLPPGGLTSLPFKIRLLSQSSFHFHSLDFQICLILFGLSVLLPPVRACGVFLR